MIWSIGHSNHSLGLLLDLLHGCEISAVADVRSHPRSAFVPHFNRENIAAALRRTGIQYAFLGAELGARAEDACCYTSSGRVRYDRLARTPGFLSGISTLRNHESTKRIAMMCTERDPLNCHRCILVAHVLEEGGTSVGHILADGRVETHADAMQRLMDSFKGGKAGALRSGGDRLEEALRRQELKIAYVRRQ